MSPILARQIRSQTWLMSENPLKFIGGTSLLLSFDYSCSDAIEFKLLDFIEQCQVQRRSASVSQVSVSRRQRIIFNWSLKRFPWPCRNSNRLSVKHYRLYMYNISFGSRYNPPYNRHGQISAVADALTWFGCWSSQILQVIDVKNIDFQIKKKH